VTVIIYSIQALASVPTQEPRIDPDFGGHAKRNEFNLDGHLHLMNGGTLEIVQIETATIDYMPGVSSDEKKHRLARMSYEAGAQSRSSSRSRQHRRRRRHRTGELLREGHPYTARARGAVLACYNMLIPYLCPELPPVQKDALRKSVKTSLVFTSVALRNWPAFDKLKLHLFWCIWYARRAGRACRSTTKIARDARNCSPRRSTH
jgi:hypothetical protein